MKLVVLLLFWNGLSFMGALPLVAQSDAEDPEPGQVVALSEQDTWERIKADGRKRSKYLSQSSERSVTTRKASVPKADLENFKTTIQPILKASCVDCHGPDLQEGNIRIDNLNPDLLTGKDVKWWVEIFAVISNEEMPPEDGPELTDQHRKQAVDWLAAEIQKASQFRRSESNHSSFRRMTKYEFNYALQDLLDLPWDFARDLPPESHSEDGFQNSSEMLQMTVSQLETYRKLARQALARATAFGEKPESKRWGVSMKSTSKIDFSGQEKQIAKTRSENKDNPKKLESELEKQLNGFRNRPPRTHFLNRSDGRRAAATWSYGKARYAHAPAGNQHQPTAMEEVFAILTPGDRRGLTIELGDQLPDDGVMRVRVWASKAKGKAESNEPQSAPSRSPYLQLLFGWQASNEGRATMRVGGNGQPVHAAPGSTQVYQWDIPLGDIYPRNSVKGRSSMGTTPSPSEYIRLVNSSLPSGKKHELDIQIEFVEVIAPFYAQWPPASHSLIFKKRMKDVSEGDYARQVIKSFMTRAWRREVTATEVDRKMNLLAAVRENCDTLEAAILEVLSTVLASPNFLYVSGQHRNSSAAKESLQQKLSAEELATRLSLFLWASIPDEELIGLAQQGKLQDPVTLEQQVKRMLNDSRSGRLSDQFVHQWLDMQLLDFLNIKANFRGFDPLLKEAMQREPIEFFRQVLKDDESVVNFIQSDYVVINERLARHYKIPGVHGNEFRRVSLGKQDRRGGILTQAGLLAMNADGTDSHPLKRGVWLLESILNDPPPPPPPAVPEIDLADPEIAKMTLKQRIENHRNHAACRSCHSKIDPWGIAFENYDALGRYRVSVRGKPVDATSLLYNRQKLDGINGLKRFLLKNRQDQFVKAMVSKLVTYALGRPLTFSDQAEIDEIVAHVRRKGDGLATMITAITKSELFHNR